MERIGYGPKELAKMLGLHPNTVYRLIWQGEIRVVKVGRRMIVPKQEVERLGFFLSKNENPHRRGF